MSMSEAIKSVFNKYATFSGRARRSEYWYWALFTSIISIACSILISIVGQDSGFATFISIIEGIWALAILVPGLALCWRRLHDIGKSGAYWFFILIPLVGAIMLLVWFCQDSQPGENQYGPNPKEPAPTYNQW